MAKPSVVRSIRIERELDGRLEKFAEKERTSVSNLISTTMSKYLEWDSRTRDYGYVSVPRELFFAIFDAHSEDKIAKIGRRLGPHLTKEMLQFWFRKLTVEAFLEYLKLQSKHSGLAYFDIETQGGECIVTIRHQFGQKWSTFAGNLYGEGIKVLLGIEPKVDIGQGQVILRWNVGR